MSDGCSTVPLDCRSQLMLPKRRGRSSWIELWVLRLNYADACLLRVCILRSFWSGCMTHHARPAGTATSDCIVHRFSVSAAGFLS